MHYDINGPVFVRSFKILRIYVFSFHPISRLIRPVTSHETEIHVCCSLFEDGPLVTFSNGSPKVIG